MSSSSSSLSLSSVGAPVRLVWRSWKARPLRSSVFVVVRARSVRRLRERSLGCARLDLAICDQPSIFENEVDRLQLPPEISSSPHRLSAIGGGSAGKIKTKKKKTSLFALPLPRSRGWAGGGKKRSPPRAPQRDPCSPRRVCDPGLTLAHLVRNVGRPEGLSGSTRLHHGAVLLHLRRLPANVTAQECSILPPISESVEIFARNKRQKIVSYHQARGSNQLELGQSDWLSGPEASQTRPTRRTLSSVSSDTGRRVKKVQPFLRNS